jgi:transposase-like protein
LVKLKRLLSKDESLIDIETPIASKELQDRNQHYPLLPPLQFAKRYHTMLFQPVSYKWKGEEYSLQMNHCLNPYCESFGLPQVKYQSVKGKPSRYKLVGASYNKGIHCNDNPLPSKSDKSTLGCTSSVLSNWSIAEEIKRLVEAESVADVNPEYTFHKDTCLNVDSTPFDEPQFFYKQGKSRSNSQRYQCKTCKKKTNVLPTQRQSSTYHQKRNDILPTFTRLLLNRTPVSRTCEVLQIGRKTYYTKLEWMYRRCLEFLDRYEKRGFQQLKFDEMWLNTDKMTYHLNNVRKKGEGGFHYRNVDAAMFPTNIVVTTDTHSRYVFRADVAYDWNVTLDDIALDTFLYKEDHLSEFSKKNARFRKYTNCPMPPTTNDTETNSEYHLALSEWEKRQSFIDGLHVQATYTNIAHYWLIKEMIQAKEWRFITDDDASIMSALYRTFSNEIRMYDAHHFLCKTDKTKSKQQAYEEYKDARINLKWWADSQDLQTKSYFRIATRYLEEQLKIHSFYQTITTPVKTYIKDANNPLEHPIAAIDKGYYSVDCKTDVSGLSEKELAKLLIQVNDQSSDAFIQVIRRRLNILERPLVTARGEGKSYIYANFNPKYAQFALTILRTYYNFCMKDKQDMTPAQRIGLTDKVFELEDIIYLR